jgi:threonine dehydratase
MLNFLSIVAFMIEYEPVPLKEIRAAQKRITGEVFRTPLVRLNVEDAPAEIYLKLETLQPIRSFKIRGASNAMKQISPENLENGVWTTSAGNWAQGVAWYAQRHGLKCTIVVPDHIPRTKEDAIKRMGAKIIKDTMDTFVETAFTRTYPGLEGQFIHPFSDPHVMAGNATIGLEILEDLPDTDAILAPWGGGGLACGVASTIRALRPEAKVYACEVATVAPLAASNAAGRPLKEIPYTPSFVDGIGAPAIWPEMWELAGKVLDGSLLVELDEIVSAIRLLAERNSIIAEGAGAASVAAALTGKAGDGNVVCIVSGGNIDTSKLLKIFQGKVP